MSDNGVLYLVHIAVSCDAFICLCYFKLSSVITARNCIRELCITIYFKRFTLLISLEKKGVPRYFHKIKKICEHVYLLPA